jgi:hypothetical protein
LQEGQNVAYDEKKDKCIQEWKVQGESDSVMVGVYQYDGGAVKVQIGPRIITKSNGEETRLKAGRLSAREFVGLVNLAPKIAKAIQSARKAAKQ